MRNADEVTVFMSSYSETADDETPEHHVCFSMQYAKMQCSVTQRHAEHADLNSILNPKAFVVK